MNRLQYNKILDKIGPYEGLQKNTLTVRLEGNICERCPSDMHRYDISVPLKSGSRTIDFSSYAPGHRYEMIIKNISEDSIDITFNGNSFTLRQGITFLFDIKEHQASYDGPWFTGVDEILAVWMK